MKLPVLSLAALLVLGLGCQRAAQPRAEAEGKAETHDHDHDHDHPGTLPVAGLGRLTVPPPRLEHRWMPGEAAGDEASEAVLASPVKGLVGRLQVAPGQPVSAGAPLAQVRSPELARLSAEWLAARASLERAQAEVARELRLFEAGAGARRDLEAARNEAAAAQAAETAARLGLEAVGLRPGEAGATLAVKAPARGAVLAWTVQPGQGVEAGQELGRFQAAQADRVRLELPPPGPAAWRPGARCEVRAADGRTWTARLETAPAALTGDTGRLAYRLRLEGAARPLPGTPLEVRVPLGEGLFLPASALQRLEGRWGVFVVEGEQAAFRPVRRGLDAGNEVLVLDGVKPGEAVVTEGAYLLKALQQKRATPEGEEGHVH